jgi:hypothetical protein
MRQGISVAAVRSRNAADTTMLGLPRTPIGHIINTSGSNAMDTFREVLPLVKGAFPHRCRS